MKKLIALALCSCSIAALLTGCGNTAKSGENGELYVYNW